MKKIFSVNLREKKFSLLKFKKILSKIEKNILTVRNKFISVNQKKSSSGNLKLLPNKEENITLAESSFKFKGRIEITKVTEIFLHCS